MNIIFMSDAYENSGPSNSVHNVNLVEKLRSLKHHVLVVAPNSKFFLRYNNSNHLYFYVPFFKSKNLILRALSELSISFLLIFHIFFDKRFKKKWDSVIFYSPTIFFGLPVKYLKYKFNITSYLILRDIFPQWAYDLKIIKNKFVFNYFKFFEKLQNDSSTFIGVQSQKNLDYFKNTKYKNKTHVLNNWINSLPLYKSSIKFDGNKFNIIYAGNIGKAQNLDFFLKLAHKINDKSLHFNIFGYGSEFSKIKEMKIKMGLANVSIFNKVEYKVMKYLFNQSDLGIVSLDFNHSTHNIPNKFLVYLESELPIFAAINKNNDMCNYIKKYHIGDYICDNNFELAEKKIINLKRQILNNKLLYKRNCSKAFRENFSTLIAAKKIISFLKMTK